MSQEDLSYLEALQQTQNLNPPAIGFINPEEITGTASQLKALQKQNNTIIQQLVNLSQQIKECQLALGQVKQLFTEASRISLSTEQLTLLAKEIKRDTTKKGPSGPLYVYQQPETPTHSTEIVPWKGKKHQ